MFGSAVHASFACRTPNRVTVSCTGNRSRGLSRVVRNTVSNNSTNCRIANVNAIAICTNRSTRRLNRHLNFANAGLRGFITAMTHCGRLYRGNISRSFTGRPILLHPLGNGRVFTCNTRGTFNDVLIAANNLLASSGDRILNRSFRPVGNLFTTNGGYNNHFNFRCSASVPNRDLNLTGARNVVINRCITTLWGQRF